MRRHLLSCLENKIMERFPSSPRSVCSRVQKSIGDDIYCSCRQPNEPERSMIFCNDCQKWLHMDCEGLGSKCKETSSSKTKSRYCCRDCRDSLIQYLCKTRIIEM